MSVSLFDLLKPTIKNAGGGGGIKSEIIIALEEDIDMNSFPAREADGVTILTDIPMKTGKYMHTLYMTQGTIKPGQKKLKGSNNDCGGFELTLEGFHPGMEKESQKWISNFGIGFKGILIIQNCASSRRYMLGEPCNMVYCETIETTWGEEIDKDKGHKITFMCKQGTPMAIYEGAIALDPNPPTGD